jgi:hypothetical protein
MISQWLDFLVSLVDMIAGALCIEDGSLASACCTHDCPRAEAGDPFYIKSS